MQVLHAIGESYEKSSVESQQRFLSDKLLDSFLSSLSPVRWFACPNLALLYHVFGRRVGKVPKMTEVLRFSKHRKAARLFSRWRLVLENGRRTKKEHEVCARAPFLATPGYRGKLRSWRPRLEHLALSPEGLRTTLCRRCIIPGARGASTRPVGCEH